MTELAKVLLFGFYALLRAMLFRLGWVRKAVDGSPTVFVSGWFGGGNLGEQAMFETKVLRLAQKLPAGTHFVVRSANEEWRPVGHHIRTVPYDPAFSFSRWKLILDELLKSRAYIEAGGSILQDLRPLTPYVWLLYPAIAKIARKPVLYHGVGAGPLDTWLARESTRVVVNMTDYVAVRDPDSGRLLRDVGVCETKLGVFADSCFLLEPPSGEEQAAAFKLLRQMGLGVGTRPLVGMALRSWQPYSGGLMRIRTEFVNVHAERMAGLVSALVTALDASVLLVPMSPTGAESDLAFGRDIVRSLDCARDAVYVLDQELSTGALSATLSCLDVLIAQRFHALVMGALAGVPLIGISYMPKVRSLMRELDVERYCRDLEDVSPEWLVAAARDLLSDGQIRKQVRDRSVQCREKALRMEALVVEIMLTCLGGRE